jgi:hypothetical protein
VANAGRLTSHVTSELKLRVFDVPAPEHAYALGLALVADNLATGYGLDRYGATLIAERRAPCAWTANAGYRIEERYHARVRYEEARLGTGATWRLFSRALGGRGADIGLGAACLLRNQERPPVWQGAARADLPLAPGLDLALSVRASRRHEMPGEDELREAISLAWGLGETAR